MMGEKSNQGKRIWREAKLVKLGAIGKGENVRH